VVVAGAANDCTGVYIEVGGVVVKVAFEVVT